MEGMGFGTNFEGHSEAPFGDPAKRAVMRAAPKNFRVEFLPSVKSSSSYVHGMRIVPEFGSASSVSSAGTAEYDIWRRWEDVLFLYECLCAAYKRAAISKRRALKKGKGAKDFNGLYKQDFASSWDSLPAGPDPESVSEDVEKVLPKISNKGSIFRPSLSAIQSRQAELKSFFDALFSADMPVLVQELREEKVCLDFFALWRRDYDLLKKTNPRHALIPSVFNSHFRPIPARPSSNPSTTSFFSSYTMKKSRNFSSSPPTKPSRRLSIESDDATTLAPQRSMDIPLSKTPDSYYFTRSKSSAPSFVSETTVGINETSSAYFPVTLDGYDEEARTGRSDDRQSDKPRPRASTLERKANRRKQLFGLSGDFEVVQSCVVTPPESDTLQDDQRPSTPTTDDAPDYLQVAVSEARQSISTIGSAADYLQGIDFLSPYRPDDQNDRYSVSTFLTMNSAEAVIGSTKIDRTVRDSVPVSLSEFEIFHDEDNDLSATLDEFPRPISTLPPVRPMQRSITEPSYHAFPPSPTYTNVSYIRSPVSASGSINVKVAFDDAIVVMRIERDTTLDELREKVHDKFVGQEGVALPESFGFIYTAAALSSPTSAKQFIPQDADELDSMVVIQNERQWYHLVSSFGAGKLNLRITPHFT